VFDDLTWATFYIQLGPPSRGCTRADAPASIEKINSRAGCGRPRGCSVGETMRESRRSQRCAVSISEAAQFPARKQAPRRILQVKRSFVWARCYNPTALAPPNRLIYGMTVGHRKERPFHHNSPICALLIALLIRSVVIEAAVRGLHQKKTKDELQPFCGKSLGTKRPPVFDSRKRAWNLWRWHMQPLLKDVTRKKSPKRARHDFTRD